MQERWRNNLFVAAALATVLGFLVTTISVIDQFRTSEPGGPLDSAVEITIPSMHQESKDGCLTNWQNVEIHGDVNTLCD